MRAAITCLVVGSLVACTGRGGGGATKPRGPVGPAIDAKEAEEGASDLVTEIYDTLGRGNKDSLFTLLDDSLIVFGPRGPDMLGTRADALVALGQVVDPKAKKKLAIRSGKLAVVPAPGGRSALAFDAANINGQPHTVMAVLTNANDLWLVEAVAVARAPAAAALPAELAKDAVLPPGMAGTKRMDPEARLAVEKFQNGLLDQAAWGDELASHAEGLVVGPTAGEVARGKQAIEAMWKKRVDARTRAAISGPITAAVTDDGQLAWVSAPITRVEGEGEGAQPLPLRAFAVYMQDGGDWKLIALHEAVAVGEPGSGATFKKVIPPKPVEPKPAELIADKPKADKDKGGEPPKNAKAAKDTKDAKAAKDTKDTKAAKNAKNAKAAKAEPPPKKAPPPPPEVKAKPAKQEAKAKPAKPEKPAKTAEIEIEMEPEPEAPRKTAQAKTKTKTKAKAKDDGEDGARPKKRTFARAMAGEDSGGSSEDAAAEEPKKPKKSKKSKAEAEAEVKAEEEALKKKAKAEAKAEAEEAAKKKKKAKPAKSPPPEDEEDEDEDEIEIVD